MAGFHAGSACCQSSSTCAGDNAYIKGAIIDDNAAIGRNVRITNAAGVKEADRTQEGYAIQDGIVVVLRGATIPDSTQI